MTYYEERKIPTPLGEMLATIFGDNTIHIRSINAIKFRDKDWLLSGHVTNLPDWRWMGRTDNDLEPIIILSSGAHPAPPSFRQQMLDTILTSWIDYVKTDPMVLFIAEVKKVDQELQSARTNVQKIEKQLEDAEKEVTALCIAKADLICKCKDPWHKDHNFQDIPDPTQPCPSCGAQ